MFSNSQTGSIELALTLGNYYSISSFLFSSYCQVLPQSKPIFVMFFKPTVYDLTWKSGLGANRAE